MAFEGVQFTDRFGRPVPQKLRDELIQVLTTVIAHPRADIDAVLKRARTIARRAADGEIHDVPHYATKALFAVARKEDLKREQEPVSCYSPRMMEILIDSGREHSGATLEARLFLEELLGKLLPIEREVYVRHVEGWKHPEIAEELGISVTTSWFRLSCAKKKLASWLPRER